MDSYLKYFTVKIFFYVRDLQVGIFLKTNVADKLKFRYCKKKIN